MSAQSSQASTTSAAPILSEDWAIQQLQAQWPGTVVEEVIPSDYSGKFHCRATVQNATTVGLRILTPPPDDPGGQQRMLMAYNRLQGLAQTGHKSTIKVLRAGSLAGCLVVVTEWIQATPLPEYLKKQPPEVGLALEMIDQLAEALSWYHQQGIALGRFKTDSVLVLPDNRLMISGICLTDLVSGIDPPPTDTVSRVYMAPETQGESIVASDSLVDVFSFGTVAYEILTTQLPVGQFAVAPSQHTGAGIWLDEVIYKAFHPKASARTQSMHEFRQAMQAQELRLMDLEAMKRKADEAAGLSSKDGTKKQVNEEIREGAWSEFRRFYILFSIFTLSVMFAGMWFGSKIYEERLRMRETAQAVALMMAEVAVSIRNDEEIDVEAIANQIVLAEPDQQQQALKTLTTQLIAEGRYEEALQLVDLVLELHEGNNDPEIVAIKQWAKEMHDKWGEFLAAMKRADMAALQGNDQAEHDALLEALDINPYDKDALRQLAQNSIEFRKHVEVAEKDLRLRNPEQKDWHLSFHREPSGLYLNVSGHQQLRDITPLSTLPFDYLDLRYTKVHTLSPLHKVAISGIALDHTPLTDLTPIEDTALISLGLRGTPISNYDVIDRFAFLKHLRVSDELEVLPVIAQPERNSDWENLLGMRFSPVPNTGSMLYGTREVSEHDLQEFLDSQPTTSVETTKDTQAISLKPAMVTRSEAVAFCAWLTDKDRFREHLDAVMAYRLPTKLEKQALDGFVSVRHTVIEDETAPEEEPATPAPIVIREVACGDCVRGFYDVLDNADEWLEDNRSQYWKSRQSDEEANKKSGFRLVIDFDTDR